MSPSWSRWGSSPRRRSDACEPAGLGGAALWKRRRGSSAIGSNAIASGSTGGAGESFEQLDEFLVTLGAGGVGQSP